MSHHRAVIAAAVLTGRAYGIILRGSRKAARAAPGVAGAAAIAIGGGEVVQRVAGRGLGWPAGLVIGGVFLVLVGREVNAAPPAPRHNHDDDA